MRLYFAGGGGPALDADGPIAAERPDGRVLVSYFDLRKSPKAVARTLAFPNGRFLDSGAYGAFTRGQALDVGEYIAFCQKHRGSFEVVAALDVIGDPAGTRRNRLAMEAAGVPVLPVFHHGGDLGELDELLARYDYVAFGGLVPMSKKRRQLNAWLDRCFSVVRKRWPKRVHGFGVTSLAAWLRYPWFSTDSSTAVYAAGAGIALHLDAAQPALVQTWHLWQHDEFRYLAGRGATPRALRLQHNVGEMLRAARYVTDVWRARGVAWPETPPHPTTPHDHTDQRTQP